MTIADFWGIEGIAPELDDDMGTSLVITRTDKGNELFEQIKDELVYKEVSYQEGARKNSAEYTSVHRPSEREHFFTDLLSIPFGDMEKNMRQTEKYQLKGELLIWLKEF